MTNLDEKYMQRCIQLAQCGEASTKPNPMVGAVIVCDGKIIGEGFHRKCGGPHAEVNAVESVHDQGLLKKSTIYVSLEPCSHWGKTPPCADMLISKGFKRVVVGSLDPNAKVNGAGIQRIRDAGIEVIVGVLEKECLSLNPRFMTFHSKHRPFITLKWAETSDGVIGVNTNNKEHNRLIISNRMTQTFNHRMRARVDAIMVGTRTAFQDNPSLTTRLWQGKNPIRVTIDRKGILPKSLKMFDEESESILYSSENIEEILNNLYERGVQHLLVEGGRELLQSFIDNNLWDEVRVEKGIRTALALGGGAKSSLVPAPQLKNAILRKEVLFGGNKMLILLNSDTIK